MRKQDVKRRLDPKPSRREFLVWTGGALAGLSGLQAAQHADLRGKLGVTTGSFMRHLSAEPEEGKLRLLDLPAIMRDRLGLKVLDLMTATLASFEAGYLDQLRNQAEKAGCLITNLKMNQRDMDMSSADEQIRRQTLQEYKRTIDAAQRLGCRWVRPLPGPVRPDSRLYIDSYRELIEYAAPRGITLLIENFGWMQDDPDAIPTIIRAVGEGLAASPDTGNWSDEVRYEGLAKAFPHAVTCDFKAFQFEPDGSHPRYDLARCFEVGRRSGYRGPWCFEHFNESLEGLFQGLIRLRGMLEGWMRG